MSRIVIVILIYHRHKLIDSIPKDCHVSLFCVHERPLCGTIRNVKLRFGNNQNKI
jgi:hypothetical protein